MAVVPSVVTVLKATSSPTARAPNGLLPFFSMSLELETGYVVVPLLVLMVTLEAPTAVTVPCNGRAAPPGAAAAPCGPLPGGALVLGLELEPEAPGLVVPVAAVVVVAALALVAVEAMPPATAPTPSKASPLIKALLRRRRPPCPGSVCRCIMRLLSEPSRSGGA